MLLVGIVLLIALPLDIIAIVHNVLYAIVLAILVMVVSSIVIIYIYLDCLTCQSNIYLYSGHCYDSCPSSTFKNNVTSTCDPCNNICTFCYGPQSTNCTQCITGYVLSNSSCLTSCPTGQFINQWSVCVNALRIIFTGALMIGYIFLI
jgi:hypothetical protein